MVVSHDMKVLSSPRLLADRRAFRISDCKTPFLRMPISMSSLARKVLILEAKLDYYQDHLSEQTDPPNDQEVMRRLQDMYPNLEAESIHEIDWSEVDVT